ARRALAEAMGAHVTTDAATESAFDAWDRESRGRPVVVFEAIGVPGILDQVMRDIPTQSRIVVVGVCMGNDAVVPYFGIAKELNIQFVLAYDPLEFAASLRSIAEGEFDVTPMIAGVVDIDGVAQAF